MDKELTELYLIIYDLRKFQIQYDKEHVLLMDYLRKDFSKQTVYTDFGKFCKEKLK